MSEDPQSKWDARYREGEPGAAAPARVLRDFAHLLPDTGEALDLASGLGGNARFLAERGLTVSAWDISPVAVEKLQRYSAAHALPIHALTRDVLADPPPAGGFDVIVVSRFLERSLVPALVAALRPAGLLYYQTFTCEGVSGSGPEQARFRLGSNELLRLFAAELRILAYREEGRVGDLGRGVRDEAMLVGLKEPPLGC